MAKRPKAKAPAKSKAPSKSRKPDNAKKSRSRKPQARATAAAQEEKRPRGRPSKYTREMANEICRRLAEGETLSKICRDDHIVEKGTVLGWVEDDKDGFSDRYTRARVLQLDSWADECVDISDDTTDDFKIETDKDGRPVLKMAPNAIPRANLRIMTRHWNMTRLNPNKYGDRMKVSGNIGIGRHEAMLDQLDEATA